MSEIEPAIYETQTARPGDAPFFIGRDGLHIPANYAELADEADITSTQILLGFFRNFWLLNGRMVGKNPREDVITLEAQGYQPPVQLRSSYKGINDVALAERQAQLAEYRDRQASWPVPSDKKLREKREKELAKMLARTPDTGGVQGVETLTITIPRSRNAPYSDRLSSGLTTVLASETYFLEDERSAYNIPTNRNGFQKYIFRNTEAEMYAFVDGRRVDPPEPKLEPIQIRPVLSTIVEEILR